MKGISRRNFLKQLGATGLGFAFMPLDFRLDEKITESMKHIPEEGKAWWLRVLSKGWRHFPEICTTDTSDWTQEQIRKSNYYVTNRALKKHRKIREGELRKTEINMDEAIKYSKQAQFIQEKIEGKYHFMDGFPDITYREDPSRARIFKALSDYILDNVNETIWESDFDGLGQFDMKLLGTAKGYLERYIELSKNTLDICPEEHSDFFTQHVGFGYNNLGLVVNYLGDRDEAKELYQKAKEILPENEDVDSNLKNIDINAQYIDTHKN